MQKRSAKQGIGAGAVEPGPKFFFTAAPATGKTPQILKDVFTFYQKNTKIGFER